VPVSSKWTKFGPGLTFILVGLGVGNVMPGCVTLGLGTAFDMRVVDAKAAEIHELSWHKVGGKRYTVSFKMLMDPLTYFKAAVLAIAVEPIRWLTYYFLRMGSANRKACEKPPICDLVFSGSSPVMACLVYFSYLLRGTGARLILLWGAHGHGSFHEWASDPWCKDALRIFRKTISAAATLVWRYHYIVLVTAWPWRLITVVNVAVPLRIRLDIRLVIQREFSVKLFACLAVF
jgi:hypothetical protein